MITIRSFTFNPFEENMYVLYDETKEAVIIDPGCYSENEKSELAEFILKENLIPVKLINTHAHLDHMLGNNFVASKYKLKLHMHKDDLDLLRSAPVYGQMWGIKPEPSPDPEFFLQEGDLVNFGNSSLLVLFTPGHCPGSLSFYSAKDQFAIVGDVLFYGSIGRTDLPGGNLEILLKSIREKLFVLPDQTIIYPGHGPHTTIGFEKKHNPFLVQD
ncbi:MAG TPA: MBL fold metallo-hydrolase [Bacteroidia bacterium]|nr:MBL fold metallo-hydrolase [Bacteroidia bacterium]